MEASRKSRCASSKKKTSDGLLGVAELGQVVEQVGQQPHQEGREQRRPVLQVRQLDQRDDPAAVLGRRGSGRRSRTRARRRTASAPWSANTISSRRITPAVAEDRPPSSLSSGLPSSPRQVLDDRAQVGQVEQGEAGPVGVVEDQPEGGLLGLVEPEHLGEQGRAERRHRRPQRDARALAAQRVELDREAGRCQVWPTEAAPLGQLVAGRAGRGQAGEVALDVGGEDRHAVGGELLGQELEGLGLARCPWRRRPGRAG